jgi:CHAD domain
MKARRVKKLDPGGTLVENAARIVTVRLDEMRSFVPKAFGDDASKAQHDLRIAAKRLRYVLEVTGFCFGDAADKARRRARDLQDVLGELHDCDVMRPRIEAHTVALLDADAQELHRLADGADDVAPELAARVAHGAEYRGLVVLLTYVEARRLRLHRRFVELWEQIEAAGTWEKLERAVAEAAEAATERRAATERAAAAQRELAEAERARLEAAERARQAAEKLDAARGDGDGATPPAAPGPDAGSGRPWQGTGGSAGR